MFVFLWTLFLITLMHKCFFTIFAKKDYLKFVVNVLLIKAKFWKEWSVFLSVLLFLSLITRYFLSITVDFLHENWEWHDSYKSKSISQVVTVLMPKICQQVQISRITDCLVCLFGVIVPIENLSLIWKPHHCR